MLTARSEGFIVGRPDREETIRRLVAFAEAGADCVFAPGIRSEDDIRAIVTAVAPTPVNVLVSSEFTTVARLAELGVRRISVGGALARAAWGAFLRAATEIAKEGTFTELSRGAPSAEFNRQFGQSLDFHERRDLSGVALRVLGAVKQQADDRRRQLRAPDMPCVGQRALVGRAELVQGAFDRCVEARQQNRPLRGRGSGCDSRRRTLNCASESIAPRA